MTLKHLFMTSGLSALAAALAMTSLPGAASAAEQVERAEPEFNRGSAARENRGARQEARREIRNEVREQATSERRRQAQPVQRATVARDAAVTRDTARNVERERRGQWSNRPTVANGQANNRGGEAIRRQREQQRVPVVGTDRGRETDRTHNRDQYRADREGYRGDRRDYRRDRNDYRNDRNAYRGDHRDARRDYRNHRDWDRHTWRNNKRYDWYGYRASNRHAYRLGQYYAPYRNYRYNRLNIGISLGSVFFGNRYQINDPWQYRLPEVYGPYRWVRYYDDVLLVNTYSGEVVDVIYDFFW